MNLFPRLPFLPAFAAILTLALPAVAQDDKAAVAKIAEEIGFSTTLDAYNNLLTVRLRLSQPPVAADPKVEDIASAAALAAPLQETTEGAQLWRIYYREAPALLAAIRPESLEYLSKSYQKLQKTKKPVSRSLFECWMLDLRFIFLHPQADTLLKDATRMNYAVLVGYGIFLATAEKTTDGEMYRLMGQAGLKRVKSKLADAVKNADGDLVKKAGTLATALGADVKSWEGFRTWFEGL